MLAYVFRLHMKRELTFMAYVTAAYTVREARIGALLTRACATARPLAALGPNLDQELLASHACESMTCPRCPCLRARAHEWRQLQDVALTV